ncbi:unnamed protein product [Strongylus vulgaris]|uniref:Uncharacterized protein n=1 Tax=Strongylus vulgaris TaxID=40348 RepID=A0A3P7K2N7_STRVU|nr:unnamed protein product [Strongylus vulgaris]
MVSKQKRIPILYKQFLRPATKTQIKSLGQSTKQWLVPSRLLAEPEESSSQATSHKAARKPAHAARGATKPHHYFPRTVAFVRSVATTS